MSEYGEQKTLNEILQDLVNYCASNTAEEVNLKLTLPASVVGRTYLFGTTSDPKVRIGKIYLVGGTVVLET